MGGKVRKKGSFLGAAILALCSLLCLFLLIAYWPEPSFPSPSRAKTKPFAWNRDALFAELEREFSLARSEPPDSALKLYDREEAELNILLSQLETQGPTPQKDTLAAVEKAQFSLAALAAARPDLLPRFRAVSLGLRRKVQASAASWTSSHSDARQVLFRLIAGGRLAMEEALIQQSSDGGFKGRPELVEDVPSSCPCTSIGAIRLCTGDILLSRGDAPTSALIARASSFPCVFSHAALVYIPTSGEAPLVLESVIEEGSRIVPFASFLNEHRHRLALLRMRPESPECRKDPLMASKAAESLHRRFVKKNIPYDFAMFPDDDSALFCAEAVALAYRDEGVSLWPERSRLDTPGVIRMIGPLGVREFISLTPQELELDPRFSEVAEWIYPEALCKDRIEDALLASLFDDAESGASLRIPDVVLLESRLVWGFSSLQSFMGARPAIPAGLSPSGAARLYCYKKYVYPMLFEEISKMADDFKRTHGYEPPRWVLSRFAVQALDENRERLEPYFR
jgi:hypothetical protein